jgi:hypothetical protein
MRRLLVFVALAASLSAEELAFKTVHMAIPDGKKEIERPVDLTFSDSREVVVRQKGEVLATIPYDEITHVEYDFAKHHRIRTGAVVMVASLGAGAVVMLTSSTKHWLEFQYHHENQNRVVLLRLDKKDYRAVIAATEARTGKAVTRTAHSVDKDKQKRNQERGDEKDTQPDANVVK